MNFKLHQQPEYIRKMAREFERKNNHGSTKSKEEKEATNAKTDKDAIGNR